MEFELTSDGKLRYANSSNYKNDTIIRKEGNVSVKIKSIVKCIVYHIFYCTSIIYIYISTGYQLYH